MNTMTAEVSIDNGPFTACQLEVTTEAIDTSTNIGTWMPDLTWTLVDSNGHFHAFDKYGKLPTLLSKSRSVEDRFDEDDDYSEPYAVCLICDEEIQPAYDYVATPSYRTMIPGRTSWKVEIDGSLPQDKLVSVVIRAGEKTMFGVGLVAGLHAVDSQPRTIEAKYLIIAEHERSECQGHDAPWIPHGTACTYDCTGCHRDYPCPTVRLLALPYANHPDYDESWRPA